MSAGGTAHPPVLLRMDGKPETALWCGGFQPDTRLEPRTWCDAGSCSTPVQGLAHVWEYIKGNPRSGTVLEMKGDIKHPYAKIVRDMLERHNRRARIAGLSAPPSGLVRLPPTALAQPNAVFHAQVMLPLSFSRQKKTGGLKGHTCHLFSGSCMLMAS